MKKEQIIEDICATFEGSKKRLVKCWNILFPEEKITTELKLKRELREEMSENIQEELEYSENVELIGKLYKICTGNDVDPEDIYEEGDLQFEDDLYL